MFGHQSDDPNDSNNSQATAVEPAAGAALGSVSQAADDNSAADDNQPSVDQSYKPTAPASVEASEPADDSPSDDASSFGSTTPESTSATDSSISRDDNAGGDDDLLDIKKQALGELSPLVEHLDQSAEEKFKTTMMMIQANDNQSLIPDAYHAAKEIKDDKARAQALLDIVNEINYFTHKN